MSSGYNITKRSLDAIKNRIDIAQFIQTISNKSALPSQDTPPTEGRNTNEELKKKDKIFCTLKQVSNSQIYLIKM